MDEVKNETDIGDTPGLEQAFSERREIRQVWYDSLNIPEFKLGGGKKHMAKLNDPVMNAFGNVYKLDESGRPVAVKFYKNWLRIDGRVEESMKEDYTGLLLAHYLAPDVFINPMGKVLSPGGEVVGLAMEYVGGAEEFNKFLFSPDKYSLSSHDFNPFHRPGKVLKANFFWKLRNAVNLVMDRGLAMFDFQHTNVLVDREMNPKIAHVQYRVVHFKDASDPLGYDDMKDVKTGVNKNIDFWLRSFFRVRYGLYY